MASGEDSRTKVVLVRKLGKQGLGSTPDPIPIPKSGILLEHLTRASISRAVFSISLETIMMRIMRILLAKGAKQMYN